MWDLPPAHADNLTNARLERRAHFSPATAPQPHSEPQTQANECCQIAKLVNGHKVRKCHSEKLSFTHSVALSVPDALPRL